MKETEDNPIKQNLENHKELNNTLAVDSKSINHRTNKNYYWYGIVKDVNEKEVCLFDKINGSLSIIPLRDISKISVVKNIPQKKPIEKDDPGPTIWLTEGKK